MAKGEKFIKPHKLMAMGKKVKGYKSGGKVHDDAAMDKKLIDSELKKAGLKGKAKC